MCCEAMVATDKHLQKRCFQKRSRRRIYVSIDIAQGTCFDTKSKKKFEALHVQRSKLRKVYTSIPSPGSCWTPIPSKWVTDMGRNQNILLQLISNFPWLSFRIRKENLYCHAILHGNVCCPMKQWTKKANTWRFICLYVVYLFVCVCLFTR